MTALFADETRWATISEDGLYRYDLGRRWAAGPLLGFVMVNPSTADATKDDPTIRRCCGFARREGYAGIAVRNLYALRATKPANLWRARAAGTDPVGPEADDWLRALADDPTTVAAVVVAWGAVELRARRRVERVVAMLSPPRALLCLGQTEGRDPRHPLFVKGDQTLVAWP